MEIQMTESTYVNLLARCAQETEIPEFVMNDITKLLVSYINERTSYEEAL